MRILAEHPGPSARVLACTRASAVARLLRAIVVAMILLATTASMAAASSHQEYAQVATGHSFSLALTADGRVMAWGTNANGELGQGATGSPSATPIEVTGLAGVDIIEIAAGNSHALALTADGRIYAWGIDGNGQLGDGSAGGGTPTPTLITTAPSGVTSGITKHITAGANHSMALTADGRIYAWGWNGNGELGLGTATPSEPTPMLVTAAPSGATSGLTTQIDAGAMFSMALTVDGRVYAWGYDNYGQLGDGVQGPTVLSPQLITAAPSGATSGTVKQIAAGNDHALALTADGRIYSWGWNGSSELGHGAPSGPVTTPTAITGTTSGITKFIAAGTANSAAVTADGRIFTWGGNTNGSLGQPLVGSYWSPTVVSGAPSGATAGTAVQVSVGFRHMLALSADGLIYASGSDASGELGDGTPGAESYGLIPTLFDGDCGWTQVEGSPSLWHTVALRCDGTVWTWGHDQFGQLGDDTPYNGARGYPQKVDGLEGIQIIEVDAGGTHSIALAADGRVFTWGDDTFAQIGDGTAADGSRRRAYLITTAPSGVTSGTVVRIDAGMRHTIALTSDGRIYTWGHDGFGQLGDGVVGPNNPTPTLVTSAPSGATSGSTAEIGAAGGYFSSALTVDGRVYTWGLDTSGQLADGSVGGGNRPTPYLVTSAPSGATSGIVTNLESGASHSVARTVDGRIYTWGDDSAGQLGDGTANDGSRPNPYLVASVPSGATSGTAKQISAGATHSLALTTNGRIYAWGNDTDGQLGDGIANDGNRATPNLITAVPSGLSVGTAAQISGAYDFSMSITGSGRIYNWGSNSNGQLGTGSSGVDVPTPQIPLDACDSTPPSPNPSTGTGVVVSTSQINWSMNFATDAVRDHTTRYSFDNGNSWQAGNSLIQTLLNANTQYSVTIQARDWLDNRTTSTVISRYTLTNPPTAPTQSAGWNSTDGYNIALGWNAPNPGGAAGYRVRYSANAYASDIGTPAGTAYTAGSLIPNTAYTFRIWGLNGDGAPSASYAQTISATTPPAAPTVTTVNNVTDTQFRISFTNAAGASERRVRVYSDASCSTLVSTSATNIVSPYVVPGLSLDRFYWYRMDSFSATSGAWGAPTACTALPGNGRTLMTMSLDSGSVSFGTGVPGDTINRTSVITANTYGATGYQVHANIDQPLTSAPFTIPHTTSGTIGSPPGASAGAWAGSGLGFSVQSAVNNEAGWINGTRYAAFPAATTLIHATGAAFAQNTANSTTTTIAYRLTIPPSQNAGTYSATVTYTVLPTP